MPNTHPRPVPARLAPARYLPALIGALLATACAPAGPPPEPTRTPLAAPWTSVPASEQTIEAVAETEPAATEASVGAATPAATLSMAENRALATQVSATIMALTTAGIVRSEPARTAVPPAAVNTAVPIAGCRVPRTPPRVSVALAADAPESVKTWWNADPPTSLPFDGEVVASGNGGTSTRVRSERDGAAFETTITTDVPLPLSPGRRVRIRWHDAVPRVAMFNADTGYGLYVGDDDGLVALILARGTHLPAGEPLLDGERGGLTIEQLRSPCLVAEHECGIDLYAAPVRFAFGAAAVTVGPGESGVLTAPDGGPAYDVRVGTSHVLVADASQGCEDWASWLLSYSVVRK